VLPAGWPGFSLHYRYGSALYLISLSCMDAGRTTVHLDGELVKGDVITLMDDGQRHSVDIQWLQREVGTSVSAGKPIRVLPQPQ
jgi:cellobiose phosphorylase